MAENELGSHSDRVEQEETIPKQILKISEMALSVDGQYVGEIGNPSYSDRPDMFGYDPETGLLINGQKKSEVLTPDDLVRLPRAFGSVSIARLLGGEARNLSGSEFEREIYRVFENIQNKIYKIAFTAKLLGIDWREQDTDWCINDLGRENKNFNPEELLKRMLAKVQEDLQWKRSGQPETDQRFNAADIEQTGVLDTDPERNRDGIISYFYLYCRLQGIDASNSQVVHDQAFEKFQFLDELMAEYQRKPDGRFGDALLIACSQQEHEWKEQE